MMMARLNSKISIGYLEMCQGNEILKTFIKVSIRNILKATLLEGITYVKY